jgi:PGF-pre-PGF domain-containing protein
LSIIFTVALALQALTGCAAAATFTVDPSSNYTTIQAALKDAVDGDTIIVNPGNYPEGVIKVDKAVTIKGSSGYPFVGGFKLLAKSDIEALTITKGVSFDDLGMACTIRDNKFNGCGVEIGINNAYGKQQIVNNMFSGSPIGVRTEDSWQNKITSNTFQDCDIGIEFNFGAGEHTVTGNTFSNCNVGIHLQDDTATIYNNRFSSTTNIQYDSDRGATLNTDKAAGKNIIGGPYLGGNYWDTPAGDGFSQTHHDTNGDGIAEESYTIAEGAVDYLPLVTPETAPAPEPEPTPALPIANFDMNVTTGNAPLSVLFTDTSQNAVSRSWDFDNNGQADSTDKSPVHTYIVPGRYTINLTVTNDAGTSFKMADVMVTDTTAPTPEETPTEDSGSSSGGSSHHSSSSSGGGGGGGSPEPAKNVEVKDTSIVFVPNDNPVTFNFINDVTTVDSITFTSEKTMGKITAIAEDLKSKSSLVSELPEGDIYKSFNVWVGNAGYGSSDKISEASVSVEVKKEWVKEKDVDPSKIKLYRFDDKSKEWVQLNVEETGEDDENLYFTTGTPGYGSFVIAGPSTLLVQEEANLSAENRTVGSLAVEGNGTSGPGSGDSNKNTLISVGIVAGAFLVGGVLLKSMKK